MENIDAHTAIEAGISIFTVWGIRLLSALLILIAGWVIGRWLDRLVSKEFRRIDNTLLSFFGGLFKYTIMIIAIVMVLGQFGVQTASLLAVLGAAGLAIGLALQGTLSNVAAGVMLLFLRPFSVGDFIEAGNISGTVKSLGLFGTEIAASDNVYIFVPNGSIWNKDIKNFSRNYQRSMDINITLLNADELEKTMKLIRDILDKEDRLVKTEGKEAKVVVSAISDARITVLVRAWSSTKDYWAVKWDLNKNIETAIEKAGLNRARPQLMQWVETPASKTPKKKED